MARSIRTSAGFICLMATLAGCAWGERHANRAIDVRFSEAVARGDLEAAEALLDQGAEINTRFQLTGGNTVLTMAAGRSSLETMQFLLDHGADPNEVTSSGRTALMQAALRSQLDHAKLLLTHGADPDAVSKDGETALSLAEDNGNSEVVAVLRPVTGQG